MAKRSKTQARRNGGGGIPGWIWLLVDLLGGLVVAAVLFLQGRLDGIDTRLRKGFCEICAGVWNAVVIGDFLCRLKASADNGNDLYAVNILDAVEMFEAERAGAGEGNFCHVGPFLFCRFEHDVA